MSYKSIPVNHNLANGDYLSDAIQIMKAPCIVAVNFSDIPVNDVTLELQQSVDNDADRYATVSASKTTMLPGEKTHQFLYEQLPPYAFIKVKVGKGSAASGTLTNIKIISA